MFDELNMEGFYEEEDLKPSTGNDHEVGPSGGPPGGSTSTTMISSMSTVDIMMCDDIW